MTGKMKKIVWLALIFFATHNKLIATVLQRLNTEHLPMTKPTNKEQWVTIFIHGTVNSGLSLISLPKVIIDKTDKSLYQKLHTKIRRKQKYWFVAPYFGLQPIDFNGTKKGPYPDLAHYIIRTYRELELHNNTSKQPNDFYLFGWCGMLSQTERRREAIRLYNELSTLVEEYQRFDITPKIRLICHSHGGNVALNLAAISSILSNTVPSPHINQETLKTIALMLATPPNQQHDSNPLAADLYKKPTNDALSIDELILLATPIQAETEGLCTSPMFKKILNVYSDNDTIQFADVVSTSSHKSRQIIAKPIVEAAQNRITQIKIIIDGLEQPTPPIIKNSYHSLVKTTSAFVKQVNPHAAIRGGWIISKNHKNLTHTDFWWVAFRKPTLFFTPLPFVIFTPQLLAAAKHAQANNHDAIDLNVTTTTNSVIFSSYQHNNYTTTLDTITCPLAIVTNNSHNLIEEQIKLIRH